MASEELEQELLLAHSRGDGVSLAELYAEAAKQSSAAGRVDEACFRYTQAYVFALENGLDSLASDLHSQLLAYGREE